MTTASAGKDHTYGNYNASVAAVATDAGFVGASHPAFFVQCRPRGRCRAQILYLPPFAEEMNRCRSLVAQQARWFAGQGFGCTILDFYGTGESPGDLSGASLDIWRQNMTDALDQLRQQHSGPLYLWGFRLGALLAMDYLDRNPHCAEKLLLWQPVTSGSAFVTQLLRQRAAGQMQNGQQVDSGAVMKAQLASGSTLDVAGYQLGGHLLTAIDQLEMPAGNGITATEILWLEHSSDGSGIAGAKTLRVVEQLRQSGIPIRLESFCGDPVWQLHKRGQCDNLLHKTQELIL